MPVKRVNLTLEDDLHETATKYAEGRGWSFSGLVTRALKDFMERGGSSPSPGQAVLPLNMDEMISQRVDAAFKEYLTPDRLVSMLSADVVEKLQGEVSEPVKRAPVKRTSGERTGKVQIPDEIVSRLQKYGPSAVMHATGDKVNKGTIHSITKKGQRLTTPEYLELLTEAVNRLDEEHASKGDMTTPE